MEFLNPSLSWSIQMLKGDWNLRMRSDNITMRSVILIHLLVFLEYAQIGALDIRP